MKEGRIVKECNLRPDVAAKLSALINQLTEPLLFAC